MIIRFKIPPHLVAKFTTKFTTKSCAEPYALTASPASPASPPCEASQMPCTIIIKSVEGIGKLQKISRSDRLSPNKLFLKRVKKSIIGKQ